MQDTLASGKVVPGYGHAVLRKTDPRFMCELQFADQYIKDDNLINLVKACYKVIPQVLEATGKVSNPWPNVDAGSGALLMHYGTAYYPDYFPEAEWPRDLDAMLAAGITSVRVL